MPSTSTPQDVPAAHHRGGTIAPAKVLVIGAGVAGLSAIATARRLGAGGGVDRGLPSRRRSRALAPGSWSCPETGQEGGGSGAYAQQLSEELLKKRRSPGAHRRRGDVVITTAQAGGQGAGDRHRGDGVRHGAGVGDRDLPRSRRATAVTSVRRPWDSNGVRVIGPVNPPTTIPTHASLMYAKNVANFLGLMLHDGALLHPDRR
ncbi:MAG: hypothetical protein U0Y82_01965 [Thermoleophilia bacterium]